MTDNRPPYQPTLGQPTTEEIQAIAEAEGSRFGYSPEAAFSILAAGETLARAAAFRDVRTPADFEEARRRLRDFEEAERKRKTEEWGQTGR